MRSREPEIARRTGLVLDPYFSATKLKWWLDRNPSQRSRAGRGDLCFGTIDTWIVFRLTRGSEFLTDITNASRTMLLNLERLSWDEKMLQMMNVPAEMMPRVVSSRGPITETAPGTLLSRGVSIAAIAGDQQAAMFGLGAVKVGTAKVTYGTGAFLMAHTGERRVHSRRRLLATLGLDVDGGPAYALEGSVFIAGAAVQWLRDGLEIIKNAAQSEPLARRSRSRGRLYMVPAFVGMGAPYWDSGARGALIGLTRNTNRADLAGAVLDAIAYQVADVIQAMEDDMGKRLIDIRVDGGAAVNDYLMQTQADFSGRTMRRSSLAETTGHGVAMLAGLSTGIWRTPKDLEGMRQIGKVFRPSMRPAARRGLLEGWHDAVSRVLTTRR
jgi:glycerol kinase